MGYYGNFGNSEPNWDLHPGENEIRVRDLKPGQKIELVRLKLLHEPEVSSMTISYAWIKVDGVIYRAKDLFGGDGNQFFIRAYKSQMYKWAKANLPKGVFIEGLFDAMRWACS